MTRTCSILTGLLLSTALTGAATAQPLTDREARTRGYIARHLDDAVALLERTVNIGSGTLNVGGVRAVGDVFRAELDALGFTTRWVTLPEAMRRGGHLVAERPGPRAHPRGKRLLLIGHLDTVFEGPGQRFAQSDTVATGAGTADMKGGDVVIVLALEALQSIDALDEMNITVVLTGDEESPGRPIDLTRNALVEAARRNDVGESLPGRTRDPRPGR
jgi:glutamate carboxypeptidase